MERKHFFAVIDDGQLSYVRLTDAKAVVVPANTGDARPCYSTSLGDFGPDALTYDLGNPAHLRHLAALLEIEAAAAAQPKPSQEDPGYYVSKDTIIHGC